MTYAEKLRLPQWQRKRLEILNRDNFQCCACDSRTKELQVHHLIYSKRDPWDYPDHCYQTLCRDCHEVRGPIVEAAADALKLCLSKVPTPRMKQLADWVMREATEEVSL